ncbi:regucalcin-like [Diabrotica virgifera virgifera]|uniref:Regucalcin n=1 Tax=Diabrotica virgifera virgifera TaxID=50390 RepID=A0A6P7GH22_DIAVI|nr:regucalcin-like [Diabrotica virgifera virgifera]
MRLLKITTIILYTLFFNCCYTYVIEKVTTAVQHAEGPFWCPETRNLLYVDSFKLTLHRINIDNKKQKETVLLKNHRSIGFVIPINCTQERYLVFADHDVYDLRWSSNVTVLEKILTIEKNKPKNQYNEGKADRRGRVWAGTLTRKEDLGVESGGGSLYMIDNKLRVNLELTNLSISNGLVWNRNFTKFYFIDSATKNIDEYDYKEKSASITNRRTVINIKDAGFQGIPDGMNIDLKGNLWIALFGGHHVLQVNPVTGEIIRKIKMPATYITSVIWGGNNFETLFVSTSRLRLNKEQLKEEPDAGSIFAVKGLGVKGLKLNMAKIKK